MAKKVDEAYKTEKLLELYDRVKSQNESVELLPDTILYFTPKFTFKINVNDYGWYNIKTVDGFATVFSAKDVIEIISTTHRSPVRTNIFFDRDIIEAKQHDQVHAKKPRGRPPKTKTENVEHQVAKRPIGRPPKEKPDLSVLINLVESARKHNAQEVSSGKIVKGYPFFDYLMSCLSCPRLC